ncbi:MAG: FKBP-type peptidyl-prolyl cis-trans isomerase [bacterium]|nr:FKBP-type peptidyl-prolyl cis-trans isomerase [bacterium]
MIAKQDLHTSPRQRIIIVLVALLMLFSTFALYASIVLSSNGSSSSTETSALTAEEEARYQELLAEYQDKVNAQASELSSKYFDEFATFKSRVKSFNAADVTDVTWTDLKVGDGEEVNSEDFVEYSAYYIGWLSDETVFDSSFDDAGKPTALNSPLTGTTEMIQGWKDGIQGMKIGGIREISIPSALGYGDQDQGSIPANSPLRFVVMLVPRVDDVEVPDELNNLYLKSMGYSAEG